MTDKKLLLRVMLKLMAISAIIVVSYVLLVSLINNREFSGDSASVRIDVSDIEPGKVKYFSVYGRRLMVLHRNEEMIKQIDTRKESLFKESSQVNLADNLNEKYRSYSAQYFVAYAYDPFYGCEVKLSGNELRPVCVKLSYDLTGRIYQSSRAETNLIVPLHNVEATGHINIYAD